uniref:Uncharacterized protein n=1 Tax=Rousettus aegyptiacus TaxID=9407 RepID=A0A7J8CI10_ROUAE|nr:hypothetical protein HJG63_009020 [Rousettus aegyptiacus]
MEASLYDFQGRGLKSEAASTFSLEYLLLKASSCHVSQSAPLRPPCCEEAQITSLHGKALRPYIRGGWGGVRGRDGRERVTEGQRDRQMRGPPPLIPISCCGSSSHHWTENHMRDPRPELPKCLTH